ncbi:hypothetical protein BDW72DRAFT_193769 [Aspergillus terricola var. indicus]
MEHKRKRLSYACNFCRQRKTRCDEGQPSCRNCRVAGVQCITTDKRRAGVIVTSRRRTSSSPSTSMSTATGAAATPVENTALRTPVSLSQASRLPAASPGLWPPTQCWDRSGWRSGRLPMMPRFLGGCMFEIMTEWLDLAFYRLRIPAPYPTAAQLTTSASVPVSVLHSAPDLPSGLERRILGERFLQTVCSVFPFLGADEVYSLCDPDPGRAQSVSGQALAYLIAATALMAGDAQPQSAVAVYLSYCNSLLGHMVAERSLQAVQAILLLAIALRSCDHIAWAWDILVLGVSMAQSIGINQTQSSERDCSTWWCLYVFEKILAFESGRASMIWDRELSRPVQVAEEEDPGKRYRQACISLANMLHELQDRAAGAWRREEWLPQTVNEAIEEKIHTGGELATLLEEWWERLPTEYRTGSLSQQSAFLSFYYRYALILLNRSVLLIETAEIREVIDRYASGKPWQHRLANGARVCVEAAREMVKLTVAMVDSGRPTYLTALTSPLSAVYALAVHIFRERHSLLIRSDFELMKAAMEVARQYYRRLHGTQRVDELLSDLEAYTADCLDGQVPSAFGSGSTESSPWSDRDLQLAWGPSALDWAGWDWNDLSHLFENGE